MRHKVCDTLEHAPWLQDECRKSDFVQVHAKTAQRVSTRQRARMWKEDGGPEPEV